MLSATDQYKEAITASNRHITCEAIFDLLDPDAQFLGQESNNQSIYSRLDQAILRNSEAMDIKVGSLEQNRYVMDGSWILPPDNGGALGNAIRGWWPEVLSDANGYYTSVQPYIKINVSDIDILQAMVVKFTGYDYDGVARSFRVDIYSQNTHIFSRTITDNESPVVMLEEFTTYNPTSVVVTILQWDRPYYRPRVLSVILGVYETWESDVIYAIDVLQEVTLSCLTLPYSTCTLSVWNKNRRFDPYNLNGIFKSIEDRQMIPVTLSTVFNDGRRESIPVGTYYQQNGGWEIANSGLIIKFNLTDIIGMLVKRNYKPPETLPTTLDGWIYSIMSSLGRNLANRYIIEDGLGSTPLVIRSGYDVESMQCGEILRFACMATSTFPRQDMVTGFLRIGKTKTTFGADITLDNMNTFPVMSSNEDVADIRFRLSSTGNDVLFGGTNSGADLSLSVDNPFINDREHARRAAMFLLGQYGGRKLQVQSRGNMVNEMGDIINIENAFYRRISARLYKQQFRLNNGVMTNVPSYYIQPTGDVQYTDRVVLTGSGTWTAPAGITSIQVILVGGGNGGDGGNGGAYYKTTGSYGVNPSTLEAKNQGAGGLGGKVLSQVVQINAGSTFSYACGKGGKGGTGGAASRRNGLSSFYPAEKGTKGAEGSPTTFWTLTSASGRVYPEGWGELSSGSTYGANGPDGIMMDKYKDPNYTPLKDTGTGGGGGNGGRVGFYGFQGRQIPPIALITQEAKDGNKGADGADGVIIVYWDTSGKYTYE